jgi:hypothetical protein
MSNSKASIYKYLKLFIDKLKMLIFSVKNKIFLIRLGELTCHFQVSFKKIKQKLVKMKYLYIDII